MSMQRIGDAAASTWERVTVAPGANPEEQIALPLANGSTLWISAKEAAEAGLRWLGSGERRRWQFGLCRDERGEWVYPPEHKEEESPEETLERNRIARQRLREMCPKHRPEEPRRERRQIAGFD
jgi:hypothetical protein